MYFLCEINIVHIYTTYILYIIIVKTGGGICLRSQFAYERSDRCISCNPPKGTKFDRTTESPVLRELNKISAPIQYQKWIKFTMKHYIVLILNTETDN